MNCVELSSVFSLVIISVSFRKQPKASVIDQYDIHLLPTCLGTRQGKVTEIKCSLNTRRLTTNQNIKIPLLSTEILSSLSLKIK